MEFLKKHYEKILLSVVLLCLALTAAWFPVKISHEKENAQKYKFTLTEPKELKPIDLTTNQAALKRLQNPPTVLLSGGHNLFNPVTWKLKSDGTFLKVLREGVDALLVTKIHPLHMELNFERATAAGYWIGIKRLDKKNPSSYAKLNEKKELFTIKEVKGANPEEPDELVLELAENQQMVTLSKGKPFQRVEGYAADFRYEPDNLTFVNKRINEVITFGGDSYKIIAITENAARVQSISTDKRATIPLKSAP
ncbi:MAG: hypothetical protein ABI042_20295 [Verrucomicrobiota bacterium]